ncbi:MAG TPA: hypothetical protein VNO30_23615 [Kofleriaceae bacterium]|nr:hypothetical protein [Kofleriaceae bacterium]
MRGRGKRHVRRPPDLTSLFDVLFIVVFVALIRAAAAQQEVARLTAPPPPKPAPPAPLAPPPSVAALRVKALESLEQDLAERTPLVVRIAVQADGDRTKATIATLEHAGQTLPLDTPLLTDSRDPSIEVEYLGDTSAELRVCRVAAVHLHLADLARHLVIIVPDRPLAELKRLAGSVALFEGLGHDIVRCLRDQRGMATLIDPAKLSPP